MRNFTLSNSGRDLLASLVSSASPGTPYRFDVRFQAIDNANESPNLNSPIQRSVFRVVTGGFQVSTATLRNVVVTSGTSAANATTTTYDATATTAGPGVFNDTNFGSLDVNNGRLLLQGGTIQIAERNGDMFDQASITYVVTSGTLASPNAGFGVGQLLPLTVVSYDRPRRRAPSR